jgi:hypothetical protein
LKIITISRKWLFLILIALTAALTLLLLIRHFQPHKPTAGMIMGGSYSMQVIAAEETTAFNKASAAEKYFRPSDLPVLNDRFSWRFFDKYFGKTASEISLPNYLMNTPKETIINYFSILREAANYQEGMYAGCGTIGFDKTAYPLAYNFLTRSYQENLSYEQYLATFLNILHISLIKYKEVPVYDNPSGILRYLVELETIGGSEKNIANFTYYYGFVDLLKEDNLYKISNLDFYGEDYLCAPYHGWSYDAEGSVQVRYGGWCKMIEKQYPLQQTGYVKHVFFKGKDGSDYLIVFYQLTNDTDIEIAQYRKNDTGKWELIKLDPQKCIPYNGDKNTYVNRAYSSGKLCYNKDKFDVMQKPLLPGIKSEESLVF